MSTTDSHKRVALALVLGLVLLALLHPEGLWRVRALALKLTTEIPHITWTDVLADLVQPGPHSKVEPLVHGAVTLQQLEAAGPCPALWDTPMGPFWGRLEDEPVLEVLVSEQLGRKIYQADSAQIHPGDVVLDVGGHLGTFTRFALHKGARLVVAFEPEPTNINCFEKTFENEIRENRVILIEAAAWESPGSLRFELDETHNSGMAKVTEAGHLVVPAVTIDDTVARLRLDRVDFIKMDIEGSEQQALRGALGTLSRFGPRLALAIYHRHDDPVVIPQLALQAHPGYRQFRKNTTLFFY
jgi:FkbM family methyltransferase